MAVISAPPLVPGDDQLLARWAKGDREALEDLFGRYRSVAYRVAYRLLGNEADALDAVQNGFVKALTHLPGFQGRSTFKTWLLRVVSNASLDFGRQRGRRESLSMAADAGQSGAWPGTRRLAAATTRCPGPVARSATANLCAPCGGGIELPGGGRHSRHLHWHGHEPPLLCTAKTAGFIERTLWVVLTTIVQARNGWPLTWTASWTGMPGRR